MTEKEITAQEYWAGFPEAPVSSTFKWTDPDGYDHMTTFRAYSGGQLLKVVEQFKLDISGIGGKPYGAQAKSVPHQVDREYPATPQVTQGVSWRMKSGSLDMYKGKLHLDIATGSVEPQEIACPLHPGKTLKRKTNDNGSWMFHKDGDGWCNAQFHHLEAAGPDVGDGWDGSVQD